MALEAGIFCVIRQAGPGGAGDANGLPAIRVSLPPNRDSAAGTVSISGFDPDGWLKSDAEAALVRVTGGPAQILVTIYQAPNQPPENAPHIQVVRVAAGAGAQAAQGGVGSNANGAALPPGVVPEVVAHCQRAGDVIAKYGEWLGTKGSKLWIEGFGVTAPEGVNAEEIEYQAVLGRGWSSPWLTAGKFCGSRGMALPLLGFRVRLTGAAANTHALSYSASFIDGSSSGPVSGGEACEAESLAPLEAMQITLAPKAAGKPAKAEPRQAKPAAKPQFPVRGQPSKRGR
jgi:hypothetical protein